MPVSAAGLLEALFLVAAGDDGRAVWTFPADRAVTVEATSGTIRVTRTDRPDIEITVVTRAPKRRQLEAIAPFFEETPGLVRIACLQRGPGRERDVVSDISIRAPSPRGFPERAQAQGALVHRQP